MIGAWPLLERLARLYRVSTAAILGDRVFPTVLRARWRFWMVIRHTLALSYPEIGDVFGLDHSTIHGGVKRAEGLLARELECR